MCMSVHHTCAWAQWPWHAPCRHPVALLEGNGPCCAKWLWAACRDPGPFCAWLGAYHTLAHAHLRVHVCVHLHVHVHVHCIWAGAATPRDRRFARSGAEAGRATRQRRRRAGRSGSGARSSVPDSSEGVRTRAAAPGGSIAPARITVPAGLHGGECRRHPCLQRLPMGGGHGTGVGGEQRRRTGMDAKLISWRLSA